MYMYTINEYDKTPSFLSPPKECLNKYKCESKLELSSYFHAACRFPTYRCRYATGYGNVICYTHTRGPYSRH